MAKAYRIFLPLLVVLLCISVAGRAMAAADSVFTVDNVQIDVTADDATQAREQAFARAQGLAFQKLAYRLMSEEERDLFEMPDESLLASMIKDFEIINEQLSSVRYIGTYRFRFKGPAVRDYLSRRGVSYTDVASKPVLVLPFYQWGSRTVLWEAENDWLAAWSRAENERGLVPVVVPIGDLQDVADISGDQAFTYDPEKIQDMLARYGAGEAIIVMATPEYNEERAAVESLTMNIYRTDRTGPEFVKALKVQAVATEEKGALFDKGVERIKELMRKNWKARTVTDSGQGNALQVRVRYSSMQEWVDTQRALEKVQGVQAVNVLALKPREATVEFLFSGNEQRLRLALAQADMTLTTPKISFSQLQNNPYGITSSPLVYELYLNKYMR